MKKLMAGIALILSGISTSAYSALPTGSPKFCVQVPRLCGGLYFGVTGYLWQPSTDQLDYALFYPKFDPTTKAPIFENGEYKSVNPDYNWAYQLDIGYVFPCSANDVRVAYTNFDHTDHDHFTNPSNTGFNLFSTLSSGSVLNFPDQIFSGPNEISFFTPTFVFDSFGTISQLAVKVPIQTVNAKAHFKYEAWDLDIGQYMNAGCRFRFRWFAGVRFAHLRTNLDVHYSGTSTPEVDNVTPFPTIGFPFPEPAEVIVNSDLHLIEKSRFEGIGPRIGVHGTYHIGNGFGIVGETSAALLVGELDRSVFDDLSFIVTATGLPNTVQTPIGPIASPIAGVTISDNTVESLIDIAYPENTRIVPNLEAKLALDYTYQICNCTRTTVTVELGYMATHYFNSYEPESSAVISRDLFNGTTVDSSRVDHNVLDTSFAGPYISLQIQI